jgi:hypothetical protein
MAASVMKKVAVQGQYMRVKPFWITSKDRKPALDVFRQKVTAGDTTACSGSKAASKKDIIFTASIHIIKFTEYEKFCQENSV